MFPIRRGGGGGCIFSGITQWSLCSLITGLLETLNYWLMSGQLWYILCTKCNCVARGNHSRFWCMVINNLACGFSVGQQVYDK